MSNEYDVCLSFAGEDRSFVEAVAAELRKRNLRVFYDRYEEVNLWGKDLYQHLDEVYRERATYCVIFISNAYATKVWTKHELKSAQARAFAENREYILPARFDDTELPGMRSTTGYIDLRTKSPEQFADLIERKVRVGGSSASLEPPPSQKEIVPQRDKGALPVIKGLSPSDTLVLGLFGDVALADGTTIGIDTEMIWEDAEASGMERDDFIDALEMLVRGDYLEPSKVLADIPPDYSLTLRGFDTYLHEFTPNFRDVFRSIAGAIVDNGLRDNGEIQSSIGQPKVVVDHVLDVMHAKQYIELVHTIGGYATVQNVHAGLRRLLKAGA